jgi:hypothetical protein
MKRLFLFVLIFSFNTLLAQTKISGVGFFKIGMSKTVLLDSLKPYMGEPIEISEAACKSSYDELFEIGKIYKAVEPKLLVENCWFYCPDYEYYLIPLFTISGIDFKEIDLTFKNDTLIAFRSKMSREIMDAINVKYGSGKVVYSKIVKNGYTITWRADLIQCEYTDWGNLLESGVFDGSFVIAKAKAFDNIEQCRHKYAVKREKERLKDF